MSNPPRAFASSSSLTGRKDASAGFPIAATLRGAASIFPEAGAIPAGSPRADAMEGADQLANPRATIHAFDSVARIRISDLAAGGLEGSGSAQSDRSL